MIEVAESVEQCVKVAERVKQCMKVAEDIFMRSLEPNWVWLSPKPVDP